MIENLQLGYDTPIAIEVEHLNEFYPAEEYHQNYLDKNPLGYCHINPGRAFEFIKLKSLDTISTSSDAPFSPPLQREEGGIEREVNPDSINGDSKDLGANSFSTVTFESEKGYSAISDALDALIQQQEYLRGDDKSLRSTLNEEQYRITQESGTELPYCNEYCDNFSRGIYVDITSGEPLFTSLDKFDAGCGWPSFAHPITEDVVTEHTDTSRFTTRTEIRSRAGNAHLGHVFDDGPQETGGLRYCINSAALRFIPLKDLEEEGYGYLAPLFR